MIWQNIQNICYSLENTEPTADLYPLDLKLEAKQNE